MQSGSARTGADPSVGGPDGRIADAIRQDPRVLTVLACWVLFPLVLAGLALGHGLALERLAGVRLPGALLAPVGLALVVVVTGLLVAVPHAARLAVPLTVAIALGGLFVGRHRLRPHDVSGAALAAAAATYVVFMGPVALSGEPTFAGYFKLDDTASFFALADRAIDHGRDMSGLPESTYRSTLNAFLPGGYPLGSVLPLAVGARLVGQDLAWVYQPWISFLAAMVALSGFSLVRRLMRPWLAAAAAFAAACSALLYGFAMWGGVKEVAHAWLLPALAATVPPLVAPGARPRAVLPMCVVAAALVGTMTVAAAVYVAPVALLVAGVLVARRRQAPRGFRLGWRAGGPAPRAPPLAPPPISPAERLLASPRGPPPPDNPGPPPPPPQLA